jgi:hypothetical protein
MSSIPDLSDAQWVKSTYSNGEGGACLEWAPAYAATSGVVPVRDSKDHHGPVLRFRPAVFSSFVRAVQCGELPS